MKFALASVFAMANGHGMMMIPSPRNKYGNQSITNFTNLLLPEWHPKAGEPHGGLDDGAQIWGMGGPCAGDACMWFNQACYIGCSKCQNDQPGGGNRYGGPPSHPFEGCQAEDLIEPTLPEKFRTYNIGNPSPRGDFTKYHPWRAPGRAPTTDPCGIAGGYKDGSVAAAHKTDFQGLPFNADHFMMGGTELPKRTGEETKWVAGGVAEVGWMLDVNHGGGYIWQLCPASGDITEECFAAGSLDFADSDHVIRYQDDSQPEFKIPAMDVNEGTYPAGSTWRRNPIPACNCDRGYCNGHEDVDEMVVYFKGSPPVPQFTNHSIPMPVSDAPEGMDLDCWNGTQFDVPFPYGYGYLPYLTDRNGPEKALYSMIDRVKVPNTPGEYLLRWRWDCEQGAQVWTHCADVTIVAPEIEV